MATLAEVEEGLAREVRLLDGERFDDDAGSANKNIALTASVRSNLTFNDDRELKEVCGAYQAAVGGMDELGEESGFGFPKEGPSPSCWEASARTQVLTDGRFRGCASK